MLVKYREQRKIVLGPNAAGIGGLVMISIVGIRIMTIQFKHLS